eukprot:CAMPEP_0195079160 /NCGR_PEP_ID=MMETSP0448-20130528/21152_1 /TAXON_ID=66468 /ORGANISM="Heterocapsa triquestra, Strain CCMP 448" /LENGTH=699 /DNA_ID=CAMNT_0040111969 /DNA_START=85 /DNA_END=2181 /DNA_ORIENTATION=-
MGCVTSTHATKSPRLSASQQSPSPEGGVPTLLQGLSSQDLGSPKSAQHIVVTLKVLRAELLRSFDTFGKMDPFAVIEWVGSDQSSWEVGRTGTHWGGHMEPVWDNTFPGVPYRPGRSESIRLRVLEKDFGEVGKPTFCGEAQIPIKQLLDGLTETGVLSRQTPIDLKKNGDKTGTITVQASYEFGSDNAVGVTPLDSRLFETPVQRIGVSGGTAPFFHLALRSPQPGQLTQHWIGKDLARATDEVAFYEQMRAMSSQSRRTGFEHLFEFMFDYAGVVQVPEEGQSPSVPKKQLLCLENLRSGFEETRMLDIKIGEKTAAAGWQGKSRFAAWRQSVLDGLTNSSGEGFRLEGFDGKPPAFQSVDPLLDMWVEGGAAMRKKASRVMLQRMNACDMFMHFFDVHQAPADPGMADMARLQTPTEAVEVVHNEVVRQLARLAIACRRVPAPQKWIGSSVALAFDSGKLPTRETPEDTLRRNVRVKIFDWGRSELNTPENHATFSPAERRDRADFWRLYVSGVNRLAWEAARSYRHRFGNSAEWQEVEITVSDFDSMTANDFIGLGTIHLRPTTCSTITLRSRNGTDVKGNGGLASLSYAVSYRELPQGSRLRGVWRISILRAANLPVCDRVQGTSDPYCSLVAVSSCGHLRFRQETSIVKRNLNPEWNETFELPLAARGVDRLEEALEAAAAGLGKEAPLAPLL